MHSADVARAHVPEVQPLVTSMCSFVLKPCCFAGPRVLRFAGPFPCDSCVTATINPKPLVVNLPGTDATVVAYEHRSPSDAVPLDNAEHHSRPARLATAPANSGLCSRRIAIR